MAGKNRTPLLVILILIILALLAFAYIQLNTVNTQFTTINTKINAISTPSTPITVAPGAAQIDELEKRIAGIETMQQAWVETSQGALGQMNVILGTVGAFFSIVTLFFAYRQMVADNTKDEKDTEMRSLVSSFQQNITTINSLIATLEKSFAFRGEVRAQLDAISKQTDSLEKAKKEGDKKFTELANELNQRAVAMFSADEASGIEVNIQYLSNEDVSRKLKDFAEKMDNAAQSRNIDNVVNPFCFYIRGLSYASVHQYEQALLDLSKAERKGNSDLANTNMSSYAEHHRRDIHKKINNMLVSCSYFQGLSYRNLGKYKESRDHFKEAIAKDPNNFESESYILQSLFYDQSIKFDEIENEYRKANEKFATLLKGKNSNLDSIKQAFSVLKVYEGNMYLKKLIPLDFRSGYQQYENQDKALNCYWEAYNFDNNETTSFSVAQAMHGVGASSYRTMTPQKLYEHSFTLLKKKVAEDHDYLYSVTLYYMLAICASKIPNAKDSAKFFLAQARHSLKEVPTDVTCLSPINKIRLSRDHILEEMETFEKFS